MHVWNAGKEKDFLHCRAHSASDLKSDCSHPPACSLPILCFILLTLPSLLHLSFPLPLYFLSLFLSSRLPFSPALFLSSPPFPSSPWISFFSLFLPSLFLPPISLLLPLYFSSALFPLCPPRFLFPLYFFLPFIPSIVGFWTKKPA